MESAFAWIGAIVQWFGQFIPRLTIVDTTQGWVKFVRGKNVRNGGPGLVWHWPLLTKIVVMATVRDSIAPPTQTITLSSGETVLVEAVIIYDIRDIEKLVAHTAEPFNTIADVATGAVHSVVEMVESYEALVKMGARQARRQNSDLNYKLIAEMREALEPYGVNVLDVFLQNKAKARVLRLVNSQN